LRMPTFDNRPCLVDATQGTIFYPYIFVVYPQAVKM
jgi:hypothetical protein